MGKVECIESTRFSDRHFWHGGYDKANNATGGVSAQCSVIACFSWLPLFRGVGLLRRCHFHGLTIQGDLRQNLVQRFDAAEDLDKVIANEDAYLLLLFGRKGLLRL